jgi:glycosyltransferase involved in cell wall biosynthesis
LKIAQVAPLWVPVPPRDYGGTETIIHLLTEELIDRGHEVTLFAAGDSRTTARLVSPLETHLLDAMHRETANVDQHYTNASIVEVIRRRSEFDIVQVHLGCEYVPMGTLLGRNRALHTIHTPLSIDDRWVLARHPEVAVAGISRFQVGALAQSRRNTRVVHHGFDFERYAFGARPGSYLAFLGRMGPQKSPLDAILIARQAGLPIILAGKPQNLDEELYFASEIQPLVDGNDVTYIGSVNHDQKVDLLRNAAALVFPIQGEEAFGMVMVEAMACGTPVVAWERASVPELVDVGVTGFYGDSVAGLASLVRLAVELDRKAVREHAEVRFNHHRMVDDYVAMYQSVIAG